MKIRFNDDKEYEVFYVTHQMDENDVPIDIVIYGTRENLEQIAEYASVEVDIHECDWVSALQSGMWRHYADHVHEALYARLEPFTVRFADKVQYTEIVE